MTMKKLLAVKTYKYKPFLRFPKLIKELTLPYFQ